MKFLAFVLFALVIANIGLSLSASNDILEEIEHLRDHEQRQDSPQEPPMEEITYRFAREFKEKRGDENLPETDEIEIEGMGIMGPETCPTEQMISQLPNDLLADPYNGISKEEFESAAEKVKLANQIDEAAAGVEVTDEAATNIVGDMMLDEEAATEFLADAIAAQNGQGKRKMKESHERRWPNNHVPYVIDYSVFTSDDVKTIEKSLSYIQEEVCVTFTEGAPINGGHIVFKSKTPVCSSYVGYYHGWGQPINLAPGCRHLGTIVHEVLHALGAGHEHSRPDRDMYVKIMTENIRPEKMGNFQLDSDFLTYGVPYDYASLMHYTAGAMAKKGKKPTLQAVDPLFQPMMGNRQVLTFFDKLVLNKHLNCMKDCPSLRCLNGGFPNPNTNCAQCVCPEGFGGDTCDIAGPRSPGCNPSNGELTATDDNQCVSSPNHPRWYSNGDVCNWIITAKDSSKKLEWSFEGKFWLSTYGGAAPSCMHYVEVKDGANMTNRGIRFCGKKPQVARVSNSNQIVVSFNGAPGNYKGAGFKLCYKQTSSDSTSKVIGNPCQSGPCQNGGKCTQESNTEYTCQCKLGYGGDSCEFLKPEGCSADPCKNGGTCEAMSGDNYRCKCPPEYTGVHCEESDPEAACLSNPCQNGGICFGYTTFDNHKCPQTPGVCTLRDRRHGYMCQCRGGYLGDNCEKAAPPGCSSSPCLNGGNCIPIQTMTTNYYCHCGSNWYGGVCETAVPDKCKSNPCGSGRCKTVKVRKTSDQIPLVCPGKGGACNETEPSTFSYQCY